ncbi:MAG TPA: thiamine pyrophosphate-dependent dehydrogenase E1 component subunit alpha [Xanthobacteraceae bacterium]|nr:thiamine pyrophosphate-dependent dehydrogenase E1 component subunit alpha [Xanthobacteraceae bacterium]
MAIALSSVVESKVTVDPAAALRLYGEMLRIRMIEEEIAARYSQEKMRCPVHLSIGQEAVAVGVSSVLRRTDQIVTTHRCHAHYLAKGGNLKAMLCELMGREPGCCSGRGGSMHLFDRDAGVLLSLPIVAASIPIGVGAAFAMKRKNEDNVAVIYLGDASVEEGVFHESANFAALHRLPVIFVCENNLYSVYTPLHERQPARPLTELGRAHGLETYHVDGNDVFAVRDAAAAAVARARLGKGASFVLADTYRWREHCGPNYDNRLGYRTVEEFEGWKGRDPLVELRRRVGAAISDASALQLQQAIAEESAAAFGFAESAPFPDPKTIGQFIYAE